MRRTQTSSSPLHVTAGSPLQRVAALLGLLALGFLVGHVHPAHVSETGSLYTSDASDAPEAKPEAAKKKKPEPRAVRVNRIEWSRRGDQYRQARPSGGDPEHKFCNEIRLLAASQIEC